MTNKFTLPLKIVSYLKRLQIEYAQSENALLSEVITAARVFVREEASYDNWNGGTSGHDVLFFLPPSAFKKIKLEQQDAYQDLIRDNLNTCTKSVDSEFFREVYFEYKNESDTEYQQAISIADRVQVDPDILSVWKPGQLRLFISHRDVHKSVAKTFANALETYGISAFVAHDTIEPMAAWKDEIVKGLETMEVMLVFVTDDFHQSTWCNQEVGFALGRQVPIVSLKLQSKDPDGFIGDRQALKVSLDKMLESASEIYRLLAEKLGNKTRLQSALIEAFIEAPCFNETKLRFERLASVVTSLSDDEVARIIRGFANNDQLHNAGHLTSKKERLGNFLKRTTGKDYVIVKDLISPVKEEIDDEWMF